MALMALMLALAANIGVGTMVSSFRLTFEGWLDQRLAAELYITTRDEAQAEAVREYLEPRTEAILPIWSADSTVAGRPGEVFGVVDHATYRDHWPLLTGSADAWDAVAAGEGVLVNEQTWRALGFKAGRPGAAGRRRADAACRRLYRLRQSQRSSHDRPRPRLRRAMARRYRVCAIGLRVDPEDAPALTDALRAAL
jgi:putative ABC transport system permease protein